MKFLISNNVVTGLMLMSLLACLITPLYEGGAMVAIALSFSAIILTALRMRYPTRCNRPTH